MLILRYLFGFRGDALTADILGAGATRTGQALEDHLASLNLNLDGYHHDQAQAMTDGLWILRIMLGITGPALTEGATIGSIYTGISSWSEILKLYERRYGVACLP